MNLRKPPALAQWLLNRHADPSLTGDLLEEFRRGRSRVWYWRQTTAALASAMTSGAKRVGNQVAAVIVGWVAALPLSLALWYLQLHFRWRLLNYTAPWIVFIVSGATLLVVTLQRSKWNRPRTGPGKLERFLVRSIEAGLDLCLPRPEAESIARQPVLLSMFFVGVMLQFWRTTFQGPESFDSFVGNQVMFLVIWTLCTMFGLGPKPPKVST